MSDNRGKKKAEELPPSKRQLYASLKLPLA
jgi:hypothetical protein